MSILSGLENLGLGKLSEADLYANEEVKKAEPAAKPVKKEVKEEDFLFLKTIKCPVCDNEFKVPTVMANRARLISTDSDLRPKYDGIDTGKYEIIACPKCGYAAHRNYFDRITTPQAKLIRENISKNFRFLPSKDKYTYGDAYTRYQLALGNCVVKRAKDSEKAFLCLKMAWLIRSRAENYDTEAEDYDTVISELRQDEEELLLNAYDGFLSARRTETFPIAGMDEITLDYLIAVLGVRFGKNDVAAKLISSILVSPSANARIKDRTRDLKEQLKAQLG